jgi:hypothetical protein
MTAHALGASVTYRNDPLSPDRGSFRIGAGPVEGKLGKGQGLGRRLDSCDGLSATLPARHGHYPDGGSLSESARLADRADEWLDLDELAELIGRDSNQLRRVWTHLSRHMRAQYDSAPRSLKMEWGTDFTPRREPVTYYSLTDAQTKQWKRVRAS